MIQSCICRRYFNESIQGICQSLITATVQTNNTIRTEMLPTPSKSHYTFNLRDLSKVVQGCMRADHKSTSDVKQVFFALCVLCALMCMLVSRAACVLTTSPRAM